MIDDTSIGVSNVGLKTAGASTGAGRVAVKDRITMLVELTEALAIQAQQMNVQGGESSDQLQNFSIRLAELEDMYVEEEARLRRLRGLLDITGMAVFD